MAKNIISRNPPISRNGPRMGGGRHELKCPRKWSGQRFHLSSTKQARHALKEQEIKWKDHVVMACCGRHTWCHCLLSKWFQMALCGLIWDSVRSIYPSPVVFFMLNPFQDVAPHNHLLVPFIYRLLDSRIFEEQVRYRWPPWKHMLASWIPSLDKNRILAS